jgi:hypothetical protein
MICLPDNQALGYAINAINAERVADRRPRADDRPADTGNRTMPTGNQGEGKGREAEREAGSGES